MAEVFVRFTETIRSSDGRDYSAQACGGVATDGLWEGWIEFAGVGVSPMRTPRETEQPNRADLLYWAEGLSAAYLEGALRRAIDAATVRPVAPTVTEPSAFAAPARVAVLSRFASTAFSTRSRRTPRARAFFDNNCRRCRAIIC